MAAAPGIASSPPLPEGQEAYADVMKGSGSQAAAEFKAERTADLTKQGYTPAQLSVYWGEDNPPATGLVDHVNRNLRRNMPAAAPAMASNPLEAFKAGWDSSDLGLALNGRNPTKLTPSSAPLFTQLAGAAGQALGDAPASLAGGIAGTLGGGALGAAAGAAAGAAVPVAGETGASEAAGGVAGGTAGALAGGGFGAAAVPAAIRNALLLAHDHGEIRTGGDAVRVVGGAILNTFEDGGTGALSTLIGGKIGGKILGVTGSKLLGIGGDIAAQTTVAATTGAALNGHLPDAHDFIIGATLALGQHAGAHFAGKFIPSEAGQRVASNLKNIYRQTGIPPWEAVKMAQGDPKLMQELRTQDVEGQPVTPNFKQVAPPEPAPYGQPALGSPERVKRDTALIAGEGLDHILGLVRTLEGSTDTGPMSVSPAGAIGRYQIMPGTARQYGFDPARLHEPAYNEMVARTILGHLNYRFHGDEAAVLAAYNAGPGRGIGLQAAGPGTRLETTDGRHFTSVSAARDESSLPYETQKYLANARRHGGAAGSAPVEQASGETTAGSEGLREPDAIAAEQKELDTAREETEQRKAEDLKAAQDDADQKFEETQNALVPEGARRTELGDAAGRSDDLPSGGGRGGAGGGSGGDGPGGRAPYAGSVDDAMDEGRRLIAEPPPKPKPTYGDIYHQFVSEFQPAKAIDAQLAAHAGLDRTQDVGAETAFRQTLGSAGRAHLAINVGQLDASNPGDIRLKPNTPSIKSALAQATAAGGNAADLGVYMLHARTAFLAARGIRSGVDPSAAEKAVLDPGNRAKYEAATNQFQQALTGVIDYGVQRGLYSPEQAQAMIDGNPVYVTLRRLVLGDNGQGGGAKFTPSGTAKIAGSDRQIMEPIKATMYNMNRMIANADKNWAIGYVLEIAQHQGLVEQFGLTKVSDGADLAVPGGPVSVDANGKPDAASQENKAEATMFAEPVKPNGRDLDATQFPYYRNGKLEIWQTKDENLARLINSVSSSQEADALTGVAKSLADLTRKGVTLNPFFSLATTTFHQLQAFVTDPTHPPPFIHAIGGAMHVIGRSDTYHAWAANGGASSALFDISTGTIEKDVMETFEKTGVLDRMLNVVRTPLEASAALSHLYDTSTRVGYYARAVARGDLPLQAATRSRTSYLDYGERPAAELANWMGRVTPFVRGHVLGMDNLIQAFAKRPASSSLYAMAGLTLPAVLLALANHLQDQSLPANRQYAQIPNEDKDRFLIFPEVGGIRIRVPLPPVLGQIAVGLPLRFIDHLLTNNPDSFHGWAQETLDRFIPPAIPGAVRPVLEQATNHSFFSGRPLIPASVADASPEMQFTDSTSEPAKALSRILGDTSGTPGLNVAHVSPIVLDNYVRGWGGTVGMGALSAMSQPFKPVTDPGNWLTDNIFVRSFVERNPGRNTQTVQDFYDDEHKFEQANADFKLAKRRLAGDDGTLADVYANASPEAGAYTRLLDVNKALGVQESLVRAVDQDPKMSVDEKRQRIDSTYSAMVDTAKIGLQVMRSIQAASRAPTVPPDQVGRY